MSVSHITSYRETRVKFFAEVRPDVARRGDSVARSEAPEAPASATHTAEHGGGKIGKSHVIRIVQSTHEGELIVFDEAINHHITIVTLPGAVAADDVAEPSLFQIGYVLPDNITVIEKG